MAAEAKIGLDSRLALSGSSTVFSTSDIIGQVMNVTPSFDADEVDVTPITSTGHRAFIAGPRSATLAFELAYDHSDTDHLELATAWSAGTTNYFNLQPPGDTVVTNSWLMRGFITNFSPNLDPSDKHGASFSLRLIEAPTLPDPN